MFNALLPYGFAVAVVAAATAVSFTIYPHFQLTNLVMVYLLGTLAVAVRGHRGSSAFSAVLSVVCFDFFFVPPRFTLAVSDAEYLVTFGVMFIAAMVISHLTIRLREEAEAARESEERTAWLMEKAKRAEVEAQTERLRSSLLSSVSHDFRTPLAGILGSASALLEKKEIQANDTARDLLENIQSETERLSHLVKNLLDATRLESGAVQIHKELYPIEEVIGNTLERLETLLRSREVQVQVPDEVPAVPLDGVLMEQVFANLLENAARHTPVKSRIDVSVIIEGKSMKVTVADCGSGLKEDALERAFDKFYHDPASPGAGLGLAICRAIVNAHGGHIWAENRAGGGAVFCFTLPLE